MSTCPRFRENELRECDEAGFTLLEMVIGVMLLTLVLGGTAAAFISSMSATSSTKQRVNFSNDAQLIAGFLTRDAQAAGGTDPNTGVKDPNLGVKAGAVDVVVAGQSCDAPGTPILGLRWIDRASQTTYVANYSYVATATESYLPQQLLRTICSRTSGSTPVADAGTSVLANNVVTTATATLSTPVAWCDSNGPPTPSCSAGFSFPKTVSLGVSVNNAIENLTPPFSFTLTASLRPQSDSQPDIGAGATTASLVLLGGGRCIEASSAAFSLKIYGTAALSGCVFGDDKDALTPFGPLFVSAPGTCAHQPVPPCTVVNTAFTDPFQTLIDSGALTAPDVDCASGPPDVGANGHWQPGTYPSDPQFGVAPRVFDPGVYVFCNGLTGDVTANLQGGPIGGTFFYFYGGAYACERPTGTPPDVSPNCTSNVQITPPTSGQYEGIAIWQRKQDPATTPRIFMSKGLVNITGTVYAPSAVVDLKNGTININQLIAFKIDSTPGNPDAHVGPPLRVIMKDQAPPYTLPPFTLGQANWPGGQAIAVDGTGVYPTWSISAVPPVTGLLINTSGVISGTPSGAPGDHTVTVRVRDNDIGDTTLTATLHIYPALTITGSLPNWTANYVGTGYPSNPLSASGGSGTGYSWTPVDIAPGLHMDATGTISGTPTTAGTYTPAIAVTDSIGNVATFTPTIVIAPPPTIASVQLNSGGTAGAVTENDSIVVTFGTPMRVGSICSGWTNDTTNKSISGNGAVIVTLHDGGAGDDTITVSATGCAPFNFGTLSLRSTDYVTGGDATFSGNGGNASAIAWNASSHTLTITLGNQGGAGTVATVGSSTPSYSVGPVTDVNGASVTNSPFALPTAQHF